MSELDPSQHFGADYFQRGFDSPYERNEKWLALANSFAAQIVAQIGPGSVLDAGCAMGFLVEKLREHGVEAYGVDVSEFAIANAAPAVKDYVRVGSIIEPFGQRYDLIVTIEVIEHLPATEAEKAVANLCAHTDDVLLSSTPLEFAEPTHVNVRPVEYWAELFARQGFYRDIDFDASFISPWAVRFRRRNELIPRLVHDYERRFSTLWKENTDLRRTAIENNAELAEAERLTETLTETRRRLAENEAALQAERDRADAYAAELSRTAADRDQLRERVAGLEAGVAGLEAGVAALRSTRAWRLLSTLHRIRTRLTPGKHD